MSLKRLLGESWAVIITNPVNGAESVVVYKQEYHANIYAAQFGEHARKVRCMGVYGNPPKEKQ